MSRSNELSDSMSSDNSVRNTGMLLLGGRYMLTRMHDPSWPLNSTAISSSEVTRVECLYLLHCSFFEAMMATPPPLCALAHAVWNTVWLAGAQLFSAALPWMTFVSVSAMISISLVDIRLKWIDVPRTRVCV